jgi:hypothetical protein
MQTGLPIQCTFSIKRKKTFTKAELGILLIFEISLVFEVTVFDGSGWSGGFRLEKKPPKK